jgi:hypothetical protein
MPPPPGNPTDELPAPISRLWWAVPAVGVILLALIAMVFGSDHETVAYGSSYDASGGGFRAAYLLLEETKFPVERSRRPSGGQVRWVLFPTTGAKDAAELDSWVKRGGLLLLAVDDTELAGHLGLRVSVSGTHSRLRGLSEIEKGVPHDALAPDVQRLRTSQLEVTGPAGDRSWGQIDGRPLVTIYTRDRGEIWLLNRPDVLTNANLRGDEDNAILVCRLAEAMLRNRPDGKLAFDEYSHGLRDRPDVVELLFRPPMLGVTLQVLLLAGLALWHFGTRFGPVVPAPPPSRRSKEEFLDAMAELLTRKADRVDAFRTVRDDLLRRLEIELGLPAHTPVKEIVGEVARRRHQPPGPLLQLLAADAPPGGTGLAAFLAAMHQLETVANECLQSRRRTR